MTTDTPDKPTRRTGVLYDPRNDWHFDIIKAFHQSLIDDRYPPADNRYFIKHLLPGVMAELERLKGENKGLEAENEALRKATEGVGYPAQTECEGRREPI
jgi:hypothetical protein